MIELPTITEASIDMSTICQLRCVECSTSKGITHRGIVGKGQFSLTQFVKFISQNPQIKRIEMSNWGEIFLNKEIGEIIKCAYEKGVTLYCGNGANFNDVDDSVLEALVKYQVEFLNLSIDGASQETYEQYRVRGNFNKVLANIKRLNYYKQKYNSQRPYLSWQFIIFGHNEHEILLIKKLCEELGLKFNPKLNYSQFSPVRDKDFVRAESGLGVADREEFKKVHHKEYKAPCYHCFTSPQINWDGKILGCSVNKWGVFGNINDQSILEWENSDNYKHLVSVLFEGEPCTADLPCYHCPNYQKIKKTPLTIEGLQQYINYTPPALR